MTPEDDLSVLENPLTRRQWLGFAGAVSLSGLSAFAFADAPAALAPKPSVDTTESRSLLDDIEHRTFNFFWETTDAKTGLAPDRWPTPSFCSIAAVGFALTAYPTGVERGWITREQARERSLTTLRYFYKLPQGPSAEGVAGNKGFFYHFLEMDTGLRSSRCELSTVDTALLLAGALYVGSYFDGPHADETEIRQLAEALYTRVDWRWMQRRGASICHAWTPEEAFSPYDWKGYNEAMLVYLLALGSPSFPVAPEAWDAWTSTYDKDWGTANGQTFLRFPPLFGHQFTHCWVDFRGLQDGFMRSKGIDYFENSRRATYAQRQYAISNPMDWEGYGENVWGVTASDGVADVVRSYKGEKRRFISYAGRGMGGANTYDDGTIAPYGAGASIAFAPEIVIPALAHMRQQFGANVYGRYGFYDAFNQSFRFNDVKIKQGSRIIPGFGWVDGDRLGIDQGPLLAMLSNYRSDLVWRTMRKNVHLRRGLKRAGFIGGWLDKA